MTHLRDDVPNITKISKYLYPAIHEKKLIILNVYYFSGGKHGSTIFCSTFFSIHALVKSLMSNIEEKEGLMNKHFCKLIYHFYFT